MRAPRSVVVGERLSPRRIGPVTQTDVVRFAGAGGDFNPLHHDAAVALAVGFPAVLAMGQMQAGILAGWISDTFGIEHLREYEVRFTAPLFLGDTLDLTGSVTTVDEGGEQTRATVEIEARAGARRVVVGRAVVAVRPG